MKNIYRTVLQRNICEEIEPRSICRDINLFLYRNEKEMKNFAEKKVFLSLPYNIFRTMHNFE